MTLTPRVTGIDVSPRMLSAARRRLGPGADLRCLAAHELDRFGDGEFDLVAAAMVLHGFAGGYRREALRQMRRIARGMVMIVDYIPHRNPFVGLLETMEHSHYQEFMREFPAEFAGFFPASRPVELTPSVGVYFGEYPQSNVE